jgi:hypothetical protein
MIEHAAVRRDELRDQIGAVNPFLDNRVNAPATGDIDVPDVHRAAFERLNELARDAHTARRGIGVVLWGEAGIGKSHLLSRLGRWSADKACFAYLHNLQADPDRLPRSLLRAVIGILTLDRRTAFVGTPLFQLVHAAAVAAVGPDAGFRTWAQIEYGYHELVNRLGRPDVVGTSRLDRTVHEVLFAFLRSAIQRRQGKEDGRAATLAVRWLAGGALGPEEARLLGLPPGRHQDDPVALEDNQQVKQVLAALGGLAACLGRPFVLAFDQVDNLEDEQFAALARFLEALIDSASNLLVVTSGIQATLLRWREQRVVQDSSWDRLAQFEVQLHRLDVEAALAVVRARLEEFLTPFGAFDDVAWLRQADPLFPLGRTWNKRFLRDQLHVRPRDVINWAREGWRGEQQELKRLGGAAWLGGWAARHGADALPPPEPEPLTPEEELAAIDRKVEETLATHRAERAREPGGLPADAARLLGVLVGLLEQCRDADHLHGVLDVERLPPPRRGVLPTYDLALRQHLGEGAVISTGVLLLAAEHATSVAGFLRRAREDTRPLDRVVLVTDERVGLPLGERGREHLEQLRERGPDRFRLIELTFAEYAELEALQVVVRQAGAGDVEVELRPGVARAVRPEEVVASHERQGRYRNCRLLRVLLGGALAGVGGVEACKP